MEQEQILWNPHNSNSMAANAVVGHNVNVDPILFFKLRQPYFVIADTKPNSHAWPDSVNT